MVNILHDEAVKGSLTADHIKNNPGDLEKPGDTGYTPLCAAVVNGHLKAVRLLLEAKANPSTLANGHTALFYATTESPKKDRAAVVASLLEHKANKDEVYASDGNMTPLMNAIVQVSDEKVVRVLVDAGADIDNLKNSSGMTARDLAKNEGMENHLKSKSERDTSLSKIVDMMTSLVKFVITYSGIGLITDAVGDLAKKLWPTKPGEAPDPKLAQQFGNPTTVKDFVAAADTYVTDSGLGKFFGPNDPFIKQIAKNAANLKEPHLNTPENIKRLTYLTLYQLIIYADDSGSMEEGTRWNDQAELVERITRVASKILPDDMGIELFLINQNVTPAGPKKADQIVTILKGMKPNGGTSIGTVLDKKILQPFVYAPVDNKSFSRPVLVCTITDGCPNGEDPNAFRDKIVNSVNKLVDNGYETNAVMFSVSRVGNDSGAVDFINQLQAQKSIQDNLMCTSGALDEEFQKMKDNDREFEIWLLKMLTAPLLKDD